MECRQRFFARATDFKGGTEMNVQKSGHKEKGKPLVKIYMNAKELYTLRKALKLFLYSEHPLRITALDMVCELSNIEVEGE
jgi:hypothetical protein